MTAAVEVLEVRRIENAGNLRAFAKVRLGCIVIHSRRIIQEHGKAAWVALPQQAARTKADGSGSGWLPVIEITNRDVLARIREAVLTAWHERETAGRTAVHRVERPADPREAHVNELARRFDERGPDAVEDLPW